MAGWRRGFSATGLRCANSCGVLLRRGLGMPHRVHRATPHNSAMNTSRILAMGLAACTFCAAAEEVKLPIDSDDKGIVYVAPDVVSTQNTVVTQGATVGIQRPDGSTTYGGMNVAGERPTYSIGASTGGDVSFSAGVQSDGRKESAGVKAGVTIKY